MTFAFVFPGQGSHSIGMLKSLAAVDPVIRKTFDEASSTLGYDLWQLVQEGPEERLDTTEYTQPAMLAADVATARLWAHRGGGDPAVVAGHSLGEFAALVCAGALDFSTTAALVKFRGQVMQEAVPPGVGAMAAVIGLADADVEAVCREAAQGSVVEAVNFNSAGQVVIAGEAAAVRRAEEVAKAKGARKFVPLAISVPSHSSLMNSAAERFQSRIADLEIRTPRIRYISAADAAAHSEPADIRAVLGRQLARPVRWTDTLRGVAAAGVSQVIECGPGKKLTGMNKRVEGVSGVTFAALEDPDMLDAALADTKGTANA